MQGLGIDRDGTFAERVAAREDGLVPVPDGADPALAASLGIAGLAAWLPLAWRAPVRAGETVLVLGATGTLGLVAVQSAKILGAGRVVAAGRSAERLERAREAGADALVVLQGQDGLATELKEACGDDGPTLVIDPLWGDPLVAALAAAAPGARIVQIGQSAGAEAAVPSGSVRGKMLDLLGYTNLRVPHDVLADGYRTLVGHAAAGRVRVDLEQVPLDQGADAWRRQAGGADAKLVIVFDDRVSATVRATAGGCALGVAVAWPVTNIGAIADALAVDYGVSLAVVGLFTTALFVTHTALQIPAGKAVDALGARRVGLVALLVVAATSALALAAADPALVIVARTLTGVGTALGFVAGIDYVRAHGGTPFSQGLYGGLALGGAGVALAIVPHRGGLARVAGTVRHEPRRRCRRGRAPRTRPGRLGGRSSRASRRRPRRCRAS